MKSADKPRKNPSEKSDGFLVAQDQRKRLAERLRAEDAEDLALMLDGCGQTMRLRCACCGHAKEVEQRCRKRWCPVCCRKIAAERVAKYTYAVARMQWPLFVTLTVANSLEAWEGIKRLKSAWGKMKRRKWFQACDVKGGITAIEITNKGSGWHPHLHSVIDCRWLAVATPRPQRGETAEGWDLKKKSAKAELDAEWASVTKQVTASTFIKRLDRLDLREVLKYAADPGTLLGEEGNVSELIRAIDKFRMVQPFGSCMGISAEIEQLAAEDYNGKPCPSCEGRAWMPVMVIERQGHEARELWRPKAPRKRTQEDRVLEAVQKAQLELSPWGYTQS